MEMWALRKELHLTPVNIARAALHYARAIAYPDLDIPYYMKRLDEIVAETRKMVRPYAPVTVRAQTKMIQQNVWRAFAKWMWGN